MTALAREAGGSYGLVSSSTSGPRAYQAEAITQVISRLGAGAAHVVDRRKSRLSRMKHGVLTNARLMDALLRRGGFRYHAAMVTLTYRPGVTWHGRQISNFLRCARKWHKGVGKPMNYVWTAEMQERGVVHYHVVFWLPSGHRMPKPDRRGWWPHGMSNIKPASTGVGYIAKYASKGADGPDFPRGVRIHGTGGLDLQAKREARWWRAPSEAREFLGPDADIRFIKGGRVCSITGHFWDSPWRYVVICGVPHIIRIDQPKREEP